MEYVAAVLLFRILLPNPVYFKCESSGSLGVTLLTVFSGKSGNKGRASLK